MTRLDVRTAVLLVAVAGALAPACTGTIGDAPDGSSVGVGVKTQVFPAPTLRRLIARQYRNAVRDLLGEDRARPVARPVALLDLD